MANPRTPVKKLRRILTVLEYLQSGRGYNARELSELCGVTRRQVFRDLRSLQDSGIAVLFDAARQAYWLPEPSYLPPLEMTVDETLGLLVLSLNLGGGEHGIPGLQAARVAATKLLSSLPAPLRQHVGELSEQIEVRAEPHHAHAGQEPLLQQVQTALRTRRKIRVRYDSLFEQKQISTLISPYRLLFARRAWYVVGRSSRDRAVRFFHLGRVKSLEQTADPYEIPERFSLDRLLGNAWRFIRNPREAYTVRIRFQPKVARNVAEVTWHKTQRLHWNDDGSLDFEVDVEGLDEISWWVFGYADEAEVLAPPELRQRMAERIARMSRTYKRRGGRRRTTTGGKQKSR